MTSIIIAGVLILLILIVLLAQGTIPLSLSFLKSKLFWIPICLLVVGGLGYYFRDPIRNWWVGLVSTPQWREMMPLWITLGCIVVLILLFWMIGKDNFGKLIAKIVALAAIVLAIWFVLVLLNGFIRMLPSTSYSSSADLSTARQSDVLSVIHITPQ